MSRLIQVEMVNTQLLTCSSEVTGQGQLQPSSQGNTIHSCNGRHRQRCYKGHYKRGRKVHIRGKQGRLSFIFIHSTYLGHEWTQAVHKQIRLSVVHQSSLFQVCTCTDTHQHTHTVAHDLETLWSRLPSACELSHLHRKPLVPDSWRWSHALSSHGTDQTPAPSSALRGHSVSVSGMCWRVCGLCVCAC